MHYGIGRELKSLNNLIHRYFDHCSNKREIDKVTGTNGRIIGFLAEREHQNRETYQKDLEEHFTITRSTASRVLNLMEQKGLVERRPVQRDARLKKLVLTEKARALSELMRQDHMNMEHMLLRGFSETEIEALRGYILRMKENMSGLCPSGGASEPAPAEPGANGGSARS